MGFVQIGRLQQIVIVSILTYTIHFFQDFAVGLKTRGKLRKLRVFSLCLVIKHQNLHMSKVTAVYYLVIREERVSQKIFQRLFAFKGCSI